ncbi:MAG: hypothetical protein Q9187_004654, partial [Circinaria calcarea]
LLRSSQRLKVQVDILRLVVLRQLVDILPNCKRAVLRSLGPTPDKVNINLIPVPTQLAVAMTQRPFQQYPGQYNAQPPYPTSPQPPYGQGYQHPPPGQPPAYGQQPPYNPGSQGYSRPPPPPPQSYGGYPQRQSYGQPAAPQYPPQAPYPLAPGSGYNPGTQYPPQGAPQGQYPPPGGQQYGASQGQPAGPQEVAQYKQLLLATVQEKGLQNMYPPNDRRLDELASRAPAQVAQLCQRWGVPREIGQDIVKLGLFNIIIYIDNSGSMAFEEKGERIKDLKLILSRVAYAASLFDSDGINLRFMNWKLTPAETERVLDNIRSEQQVEALVAQVPFKGLTPIGTELRNQVIDPLVLGKARKQALEKPVLIITITDGQPAGENPGTLAETIRHTANELSRMPQYGRGAASFQFAQVGNDKQAQEFLSSLDSEPGIGDVIDCTSNFENEQEQMMKSNPPVDLTPDLWLIKLMLGSIDSSYDTQDEQSARPQGGQGYGAPPPGQYGAPPPGQHGAPGGYGQQQGGYPPAGQGQGAMGNLRRSRVMDVHRHKEVIHHKEVIRASRVMELLLHPGTEDISQFSLSLELSKVIPFGSTLTAASRGMLHLVRELQNSGSNIVTEEDLAEVFGRNFIAPHFASTFRTAVKTSAIYRFSEIAELVLEAGAGPTVRRAVKDSLYFPTVVQLSLLLWPHDINTLARALAKALEHRAPQGACSVPRIDALLGTLRCIRQQTSGFMWELLFAAEEQRLKDHLLLTAPFESRPIPYIILQSLLDALTAIQRMPDSYHLQVRTIQGIVTLVVWAHHVLGITLEVQSDHGVVKIGKDTTRMTIDCRSESSTPEVILFNEVQDLTFRAVADANEDPMLDPDCRHPLHGYGSKTISLQFDDTSYARDLVLHVVNSTLRIAEESVAEQQREGLDVLGNIHTPSKQQIIAAASVLFPQYDISMSELDSLAQEICLLRSDWQIDKLPSALIKASPANIHSNKSLQRLAKDLSHLIFALSMVGNVEELKRVPLSLYSLPAYPAPTVHCPTARDAFETMAILLLGEVPSKKKLANAAVVSAWGWSLCVSSIVAVDPGDVRSDFAIVEGVPSKFGERKEWVEDAACSLITDDDSNRYIRGKNLRVGTVLARSGDAVALKSFIRFSSLQYYVGLTETTFSVFKKFTYDFEARKEAVIFRIGFRRMQDLYWDTCPIRSCDHDIYPESEFIVPEDTEVFAGLGRPLLTDEEADYYLAQLHLDGRPAPIVHLLHIIIGAGESPTRWVLLYNMTVWLGPEKRRKGHKAIYIRCGGCCIECAIATVKRNMLGNDVKMGLLL